VNVLPNMYMAYIQHYTIPVSTFFIWVPGVKRPRSAVKHPPSSSGEVKERVELYIYSQSVPNGTLQDGLFSREAFFKAGLVKTDFALHWKTVHVPIDRSEDCQQIATYHLNCVSAITRQNSPN